MSDSLGKAAGYETRRRWCPERAAVTAVRCEGYVWKLQGHGCVPAGGVAAVIVERV